MKIWKWFKSLFSFGKFVHPVVNEELSNLITDELGKRRTKQVEETEKHNEVLNGYLRTYFSTHYNDTTEMALAFELSNKKWKRYCRDVNATSKLINVSKEAFSNRVKMTINQLKENKQNELQNK